MGKKILPIYVESKIKIIKTKKSVSIGGEKVQFIEVSGKLGLVYGANGPFARRLLNENITVICGGSCWGCANYSHNPGCKITDILLQICSKYWNHLLLIEDN